MVISWGERLSKLWNRQSIVISSNSFWVFINQSTLSESVDLFLVPQKLIAFVSENSDKRKHESKTINSKCQKFRYRYELVREEAVTFVYLHGGYEKLWEVKVAVLTGVSRLIQI